MANWTFDVTHYEEQNFQPIPAGDHRVRISDVVEKVSRNGNEMYEITLEVSGYNSRLWYYLVLDRTDIKKTNQRIGEFFNSFGITDHNMGDGRQWVGKAGAIRVKHEEYGGKMTAKVAYVISRKNQDKLEPWKDNGGAATPTVNTQPVINESDLPF